MWLTVNATGYELAWGDCRTTGGGACFWRKCVTTFAMKYVPKSMTSVKTTDPIAQIQISFLPLIGLMGSTFATAPL